MIRIASCGSKGPLRASNSLPAPLEKFPAGKFVEVFKWKGDTDETFSFAIRVKRGGDSTVEWRRLGKKGALVSSGSFQKQMDLTITPADEEVVIEAKVDKDGVVLEVELTVAALQRR